MIKKIICYLYRYVFDESFRFGFNQSRGLYKSVSDEVYLKKCFKIFMKQKLNLDSPVTFNEKLQWLKIYNRNTNYTEMVDKYKVREYIARTIGEEYLIPIIGVWDSPEDIDFDSLPNQFVLKCNHNSGKGMCICKDKNTLNYEHTINELRAGIEEDYYLLFREWPYKNVQRKIIAEKFMTNRDGSELQDYKIHCFNGVPKFILVCKDRFSESGLTEDFYDIEWKRMPLAREKHPNSKDCVPMPKTLNKMLQLAEKLSQNIPFLRVDFYEIDGKIFFGELTFFPASGLERFVPENWDYLFGEWINITKSFEHETR